MKHFDVVVVGGGHAGCEAAHASARMGAKTALITMAFSDIGTLSCNPAIGGLGKGHLVREIDAMDGIMARIADKAGIQFRMLNRRKGPAVRGPRAQMDRVLYRKYAQNEMSRVQDLSIIEAEVIDVLLSGHEVSGITLSDGTQVGTKAIVLTTGTFLRGVMHIGDSRVEGGRFGQKSSTKLAGFIEELGLPLGRLKTGTPPRLAKQSIDWSCLQSQPGDDVPEAFSFLSGKIDTPQIECGITHTNEVTHSIISENIHLSAMYGGMIDGIGPRYCPSIEDKVVRFSDKTSHQIFLEPEGLSSDLIYPNGISTSLPLDVQDKYVHSIKGLERAEIVQPGYAIEYDFVNPVSLSNCLELRCLHGFFLAGQINGTTGYEEAGAQGLVAGLNAAARALGHDEVHFSRSTSYIGVMIDDLVTKGVSEPYRMFTSRAEFRLSLRADNADQRMTPVGFDCGCVSAKRRLSFEKKLKDIEIARSLLSKTVSSSSLQKAGVSVAEDGKQRTLHDVLAFPNVSFDDLVCLEPRLAGTLDNVKTQVCNDALYSNYLVRQQKDIEKLKRDEDMQLPEDFEFFGLPGLSNELASKLSEIRPENLGQASRIEGMTPAALAVIASQVRLRLTA